MAKPLITIIDLATDTTIEREMDSDELAQYEADQTEQAEREAEQAAKVAARQAVLDKLGLTADEVAALLN